jgi:HAD superfamily hydrolase (TIGR01490 family)
VFVGQHNANIGSESVCIYHCIFNRVLFGDEPAIVPHFSSVNQFATMPGWPSRARLVAQRDIKELKRELMALVIFDLDNTLLGGDSDHAFGEFACESGLVDSAGFSARNDAFYADYQSGDLDIDAYLRHALSPLAGQSTATADRWHLAFMRAKIEPMLLPKASALIDRHRQQGDRLLIITATNRYITQPIAQRLGINELIACEAEIIDGHYTGAPIGTPSYGAGKVVRLLEWLEETGETLAGSWFYSDSHNDIPLLVEVDHAVAVDPDERLRAYAQEQGWPIISLRD